MSHLFPFLLLQVFLDILQLTLNWNSLKSYSVIIGNTAPLGKDLLLNTNFQFFLQILICFADKMTEKSGGNGGSLSLIYEADQWKTLAFQEIENAYALCEFIGRVHQNI